MKACPHCTKPLRQGGRLHLKYCIKNPAWRELTLARIMDHVTKTLTCWEWTGSRDPYGYGKTNDAHHRLRGAHRVVYELMVGPLPEGTELDHLCLNKICVRPDHLEAVTHRENVIRERRVRRLAAAAS